MRPLRELPIPTPHAGAKWPAGLALSAAAPPERPGWSVHGLARGLRDRNQDRRAGHRGTAPARSAPALVLAQGCWDRSGERCLVVRTVLGHSEADSGTDWW